MADLVGTTFEFVFGASTPCETPAVKAIGNQSLVMFWQKLVFDSFIRQECPGRQGLVWKKLPKTVKMEFPSKSLRTPTKLEKIILMK